MLTMPITAGRERSSVLLPQISVIAFIKVKSPAAITAARLFLRYSVRLLRLGHQWDPLYLNLYSIP